MQQKKESFRTVSGILLKGTLWAKDETEEANKRTRWVENMPDEAKNKIKSLVYSLLSDPSSKVASQAAQIIAKIALVELPRGQWSGLIEALLQNVTSPQATPSIKKSTLDTLGYICEEIDPGVLDSYANQILTAVVHGMRPEEKNNAVTLAACNALSLL